DVRHQGHRPGAAQHGGRSGRARRLAPKDFRKSRGGRPPRLFLFPESGTDRADQRVRGGRHKGGASMPKKTIAVMGATGHIGTTLSEILLSKGHEVRALGRDAKKLGALSGKGAKARSVAFTDPVSLAESFAGADAAFVMIPPSYGEADFSGYQDRQTDAIVKALQKAGVRKVVSLSSVGAHQPGGTGPIAGLGRMEKRLNQSGGPDVVHLRPSYFMENHFFGIPVIKGMGVFGSPIKPDLAFSQIATKDIAAKAAELIDRQDFKGSAFLELAGPRELTMTESTAILGKAIGKPDLKY